MLLKARVPNEDRALWPGQFVNVALQLDVEPDVVTVPSVAVVTTGTSSFVYVMEDHKAKRTIVKLGRLAGSVVRIDSGLVGGEQVIIEGQTRLSDGAAVQLRGENISPRNGDAGSGQRRQGRNGGNGNGGGNGGEANAQGGRQSGGQGGQTR